VEELIARAAGDGSIFVEEDQLAAALTLEDELSLLGLTFGKLDDV
jgi:hypothetical protein